MFILDHRYFEYLFYININNKTVYFVHINTYLDISDRRFWKHFLLK